VAAVLAGASPQITELHDAVRAAAALESVPTSSRSSPGTGSNSGGKPCSDVDGTGCAEELSLQGQLEDELRACQRHWAAMIAIVTTHEPSLLLSHARLQCALVAQSSSECVIAVLHRLLSPLLRGQLASDEQGFQEQLLAALFEHEAFVCRVLAGLGDASCCFRHARHLLDLLQNGTTLAPSGIIKALIAINSTGASRLCAAIRRFAGAYLPSSAGKCLPQSMPLHEAGAALAGLLDIVRMMAVHCSSAGSGTVQGAAGGSVLTAAAVTELGPTLTHVFGALLAEVVEAGASQVSKCLAARYSGSAWYLHAASMIASASACCAGQADFFLSQLLHWGSCQRPGHSCTKSAARLGLPPRRTAIPLLSAIRLVGALAELHPAASEEPLCSCDAPLAMVAALEAHPLCSPLAIAAGSALTSLLRRGTPRTLAHMLLRRNILRALASLPTSLPWHTSYRVKALAAGVGVEEGGHEVVLCRTTYIQCVV
jgi:hypothetical protein